MAAIDLKSPWYCQRESTEGAYANWLLTNMDKKQIKVALITPWIYIHCMGLAGLRMLYNPS